MSEGIDRFGLLEIPEDGKGASSSSEGEEKSAAYYLEAAEKHYYDGFYEDALRSYCRALKYNKGMIPAWVGQIKCLLRLDEREEAETWVNNALNYFPRAPELFAAKASVLCSLGRFDAALVCSDNSFERESDSEYPWLARAETLFCLRRDKSAEKCLERILASNAGDWRIYQEASEILCRHDMFTRAVYYLNKALEINPGNAWLWFLTAKCYAGMHMRSKVRFCCERALQIRHTFPGARDMLDRYSRKPCFVATVCFGCSESEEVVILRRWRDDHLNGFLLGSILVRSYEIFGPFLARVMGASEMLRVPAKFVIAVFIRVFLERRGNEH